jgi:PIN domain nuclease of toxin-antitoxin system
LKLLLDTHIWLWSILTPDLVRPRVRKELEASASELWLSPLSIWEYFLLCRKGRFVVDREPIDWLSRTLAAAPMKDAPLTYDIAVETERVTLPHRDPVDRFLVATARVLDLTLVTADQKLIEAMECPIMANK